MAQTSNTFRIFVSSTFSDLHAERNALQRFVFPRLRELCLQNGCRFQAIDLRWGVSAEAGRDQKTMQICLEEIKRCQRVTPRPNFIVLLGDRYGWCPLPEEISADEFEKILERVSDNDKKDLLWNEKTRNGWYRLDENAVPPSFCLQPREGKYAEYSIWEKVERKLRGILENATADFDEKTRTKYVASATEQEINQGLEDEKAAEHIFCFFRNFSNRNILSADFTKQTGSFFELDENKQPNEIANQKLATLKNYLRENLPKQNVHDYPAQWLENSDSDTPHTTDHIGSLPDNLEDCLKLLDKEPETKNLCLDVWRQLSRVILEEIGKIKKVSDVEKEKDEHEKFGADRAKYFVGRTDYLDKIREYVEGNNRQPLCLWGKSGSGKSALMAYAAKEIKDDLVIRFIGATPPSSDIRTLLESLCQEISEKYDGDKTTIPADYNELIKEFPKRLELDKKGKRLVLFLDALDQLSDAENAQNLRWLPENLPENVRLIVSTIDNDCLTALKRKLLPENIIELKPMSKDEGGKVLDLWLADKKRTLQDRQRTEILNKFAANGLPLYLKFAFEEAWLWHSYDEIKPLATKVEGIIGDLFKRLSEEKNHGAMMVSRSLSYLAASRYGLTEDELLDVLSMDEEVMNSFRDRSKNSPDVDSLPVVVWSRLYFDLEPYLTERMANNTSLLSFYHRQLSEVVGEDFLTGEARKERHYKLANYFQQQPLYIRKETNLIPNIRKVIELPFQQTRAERWDELETSLCNVEFLDVKCKAEMARDLVFDFDSSEFLASQQTEVRQIHWSEWRSYLKKNVQRLAQHPAMFVALTNHEGFADARKQVASAEWEFSWLRTTSEKMPLPLRSSPKKNGLRAKVLSNLEFSSGQPAAISENRKIAFRHERLGSLRLIDLNEMQETDTVLTISRERPLVLASDPNGTGIAVFYESGEAKFYRCVSGTDDLPNALELAVSFQFFLPECEDPIVVWHDGAFWFQSNSNTLSQLVLETAQIVEEQLPDDVSGELSSLVFTETVRLLSFRQETDSLLFVDGAEPLRLKNTHVSAACYCGELKVATALTDGSIAVFNLETSLEKIAEIKTEIIFSELGWDGKRIIWLSATNKFCSWIPTEGTSKLIEDNQEIFPDYLHIRPQRWLSVADNAIMLLTTHSFITFQLNDGDASAVGRIETLFGGKVWRAVRKVENDQWLVGGNQTNEVLLGKGVLGRLYCAIDGRGHLFVPSGYGPGLVFNLEDFQCKPIIDCPLAVSVADGDAEEGCWFTDRSGDIYYIFADGRCECVAKTGLRGARGSRVQVCGDFIVWYGYSDHWFKETGTEAARAFVFYRKESSPKPQLEKIGEHFFAVQEGLCITLNFDTQNKRLVMIWTIEASDRNLLRVTTIEDFVDRRFDDKYLDRIGPLGSLNAALSPDGRWLGLINMAGELWCVRVEDGQAVAMLAGSSPFNAIAPGKGLADFWFVEARTKIYHCQLENAL